MKKKFCSVFVAALVGTASAIPVSGQTNGSAVPQVLTLDKAIALALENDPELRAAAARVDAAAGRAVQSRQWSNPQLELSAEDWPVSNGRGFSDAKQLIGVSQALPYPGKKALDRKIGEAGVRQSEAEVAIHRAELVRDVKAAFYQVLGTQGFVELSSNLVQVAESAAATAKRRVDAGDISYQEQLRAEIELERARIELSRSEREFAGAKQLLAIAIGHPQAPIAVSGSLAESAASSLLEQQNAWVARHPSMKAARANLERANAEAKRARLEPYPDITVSLAGGRIGESDQSIVQLGFSVPLPIIDRSKGRKQEARANVKAAEAELALTEQRLLREWSKASERFRTAVEEVSNHRQRILPKASEALRLVQSGFEQGKFGFIDLLDTQRTTAEARLAYQQKLLEMSIAQAELEALLDQNPAEQTSTASPKPNTEK